MVFGQYILDMEISDTSISNSMIDPPWTSIY